MRCLEMISAVALTGLALMSVMMDSHLVLAQGGVCEWKMAFKAVARNGRNVFNDYLTGGNINQGIAAARKVATLLPYRDASILDKWDNLDIEKVRVEVYENGVRASWILFNTQSSSKTSWFTRERVLASIHDDIKYGKYNYFSISGAGHISRRFFINRHYGGCPKDCGFLDVVDGKGPNGPCGFDKLTTYPYFLYGKKTNSCSTFHNAGQRGVGDRFVIWTRICN